MKKYDLKLLEFHTKKDFSYFSDNFMDLKRLKIFVNKNKIKLAKLEKIKNTKNNEIEKHRMICGKKY